MKKPEKDPFLIQKSKTVKTAEAMIRAIDDLNELRPLPQLEPARGAMLKAIETIRALNSMAKQKPK